MSTILKIQFPQDFENRYTKYKEKILGNSTTVKLQPSTATLPTPKSKIITVQLKYGRLMLNESTGSVEFNEVKATINPQGQEFAILLKLTTNDEYLATYKDFLGENPSKDAKRKLGFIIRNLKEILGILPKGQAKNKDCIQNIKGHGYKLIT